MASTIWITAAQRALRWRAQPAAIQRQLARERYEQAPPPDGRQVRLGVVQLKAHLHRHVADYVAQLYRLTAEAVAQGAQLIAFPEDTGSYPLAGLIPGIERLAAGAGHADAPDADSQPGAVLALFRILAPAAGCIYRTAFATLARSFGVHILAGSTVVVDDAGRVYKEAHLYGPSGELLLAQRKTHLFPLERVWGLSAADEIQVAMTPVGAIAAPICMDHTYFEPVRVAWLQGAEIIIDPAADAGRYHFWLQARGVWGRVQESPAYGVHALMVGHILGNTFGGRSGVYAPLGLSPGGDGVLAQAADGEREEVFCADLDLASLRAYRLQHAPDFNLDLYRRYLPSVYIDAGLTG